MLKRRIVYTIVFLQFFLLNSFAVGSLVKEECILIINANSDLSPLSNHIISELIYKFLSNIKVLLYRLKTLI